MSLSEEPRKLKWSEMRFVKNNPALINIVFDRKDGQGFVLTYLEATLENPENAHFRSVVKEFRIGDLVFPKQRLTVISSSDMQNIVELDNRSFKGKVSIELSSTQYKLTDQQRGRTTRLCEQELMPVLREELQKIQQKSQKRRERRRRRERDRRAGQDNSDTDDEEDAEKESQKRRQFMTSRR